MTDNRDNDDIPDTFPVLRRNDEARRFDGFLMTGSESDDIKWKFDDDDVSLASDSEPERARPAEAEGLGRGEPAEAPQASSPARTAAASAGPRHSTGPRVRGDVGLDLGEGSHDNEGPQRIRATPQSRRASDLSDVKAPPPGRLGGYLAGDRTIVLGSAGSGVADFGLRLAASVAMGAEFLGFQQDPGEVLYADARRPLSYVKSRLRNDLTQLKRLSVFARDQMGAAASVSVHNELEKMDPVSLVVVIEPDQVFATEAPGVFIFPTLKARIAGPHVAPKGASDAVDRAASVLIMNWDAAAGACRLSHYEYGDLIDEMLLDPATWTPLGKPAPVQGSRETRVLAALKEAGEEGLSPGQVAALTEISPNNAYQALFNMKGKKVSKFGNRYYLPEFAPADTPAESK